MNLLSRASYCLIVLSCTAAQAGFLVAPVSVIQNDLGEWVAPGHGIENAIDQSGLSSTYDSGITDTDEYLANDPTHFSQNAFGGDSTIFVSDRNPLGPPLGNIDFDLGDIHSVDSFILWQGTYYAHEQLAEFEVFTSNEADFSGATSVGAFTAVAHLPSTLAPAQRFNLDSTVARYVRLQVQTTRDNNGYVDLGEIAFDVSVAEVPEPASIAMWSMMGAAGVFYRRRRKNTVTAV